VEAYGGAQAWTGLLLKTIYALKSTIFPGGRLRHGRVSSLGGGIQKPEKLLTGAKHRVLRRNAMLLERVSQAFHPFTALLRPFSKNIPLRHEPHLSLEDKKEAKRLILAVDASTQP
jgi:hypothetical protein